MTSPTQQAQDALLAFSRTQRLEERAVQGHHYLGDSPLDLGYRVKLTLSVRHSQGAKSYAIDLAISEERFQGGFASQRYGFGMEARHLGDVPATRFGEKRATQIFSDTLRDLRSNPQILIDLLAEESERS